MPFSMNKKEGGIPLDILGAVSFARFSLAMVTALSIRRHLKEKPDYRRLVLGGPASIAYTIALAP